MSKMSKAAELVKTAASTMKSGVKGAASTAGSTFKAGVAASESKGAGIVADKAMESIKKEAARASAKAVTGDAFKKGIKSGVGSIKESTSSSVTGGTLKRAAERLTDSDYISSAVKPGIASAFEQAGGRTGMAKRIVGGAAIGGATTGTIGALQGRDFWEDAKGGAWRGGLAGGGRQIYKMGKTDVGSELLTSARGQMTTARSEASQAQGMKEARDTLDFYDGPNKETMIGKIGASNASNYQSKSFMENVMGDMKTARENRQEAFSGGMARAEARGQQELDKHRENMKAKKSSPDIPTRQDSSPKDNVSNPVRVLERANTHSKMSNSLLGNHQGGRAGRGMRPMMR